MGKEAAIIDEQTAKAIFVVRDQKLMLDSDLAQMYGVETRILKQAVRNNIERFPEEFMFELSFSEWQKLKESLRSQIEILNEDTRGKHSKYPPFVFTEQGVAMLSSVLNSPQAIQVNISIIRVFVKMRQWAANYSELVKKIEALQKSESVQNHHIARICQIIVEHVKPKIRERKPIGYQIKTKKNENSKQNSLNHGCIKRNWKSHCHRLGENELPDGVNRTKSG